MNGVNEIYVAGFLYIFLDMYYAFQLKFHTKRVQPEFVSCTCMFSDMDLDVLVSHNYHFTETSLMSPGVLNGWFLVLRTRYILAIG